MCKMHVITKLFSNTLLLLIATIYGGGIVSATLMNEGTVRCGRLLCRPVSGLFADNPLQEGYSLVAQIPRGASNISITELRHSANRLAIRPVGESFAINGDDTEPTDSGVFDVADALFDYRQIGPDADTSENIAERYINGHHRTAVTEWLTSTGPINQPIDVMVLAYDHNPGIKYEYLVPAVATTEHLPPTSDEYSYESNESSAETLSNSVLPAVIRSSAPSRTTTTTSTTTTTTTTTPRPRRKRRFLWKITGYGTCTKTCGGGFQMPIIRCVRESPLRYFVAKKCAHLQRPVATELVQRCNTAACPGYWRLGEWSRCAECGRGSRAQHQVRDVTCVQELGTGIVIQIPAAACTDSKPIAKQSCPPCRSTKPARSGMVADQAVIVPEDKDRGVWLASAWSDECARDCQHAPAIEHRTIFCDRTSKFSKRCELSLTPTTSRQCAAAAAASVCAHGEWLVGDWSKCGGDCFNLTQSRNVVCVQDGQIVDGIACRVAEKPLTQRGCGTEEVAHCLPQWHYSEWSKCSKSCSGGNQRRTVKCVRASGSAMKETEGCKFVDRQLIFQECNTQACADVDDDAADDDVPINDAAAEAAAAAPADLIQNDTDTDCVDKLTTCQIIQLQHLCGQSYFASQCCYTCTKSHDRNGQL